MTRPPFHLAIRVDDLIEAERFYAGVLGAGVGRRGDRWIDFDLLGHQVVVHLDESMESAPEATNPVDGNQVPVPHFGIVFPLEQWRALGERLRQVGVDFVIAPRTRFEGEPGEQGTFFVRDPAGNAIEFKGFKDMNQLFAR